MTTAPRLILDIGTHKVLGLAVLATADGIEVLAHAMRAHGSRAMRDGQVHDVPAVARTVRTVVSEIERDLRLLAEESARDAPFSPWGEEDRSFETWSAPFTEAYIAAAGRALQTARGRAEQAEPRPVLITAAMQRALEWDAVADAQATLLATLPAAEHGKGFYCIAHTRTESLIDGEQIASLVDQRGSRFSVEVLATFLPGIVVDSLQSVLRKANLEMRGLTLEPVAALEAVVPQSMRHLRLMLVDVGAGTTDIAFTGDGTVQAYAMVPVGGDAMTAALAHEFLLDFNVAEDAKRVAAGGRTATATNALGDPVQIDPDRLWDAIAAPATELARAVGRVAESWDLTSLPDAVLLVGGGSNTPRLPSLLAEELNMPPNRIAVRDRSAVRGAVGEDSLQGPDVVTALGIGLRFATEQDAPPVRVRVNGRPVSLFQPDRCTVREAARIAGLPLNRLVGRLGQGMTVTVNGELLVIPGRRGNAAAVRVNGEPASLDTLLQMNDDVELENPDEGDSARLTVGQLVERWQRQRRDESGLEPPAVVWNDARRPLPLLVRRRGRSVSPSETVLDRDEFEFRWPQTVGELLELDANAASAPEAGRVFAADWKRPFPIVLNGNPTSVDLPADLRLNGEPAGPSARIKDGDQIHVEARSAVALYELLSHPQIDALRRGGLPSAHGDALEPMPASRAEPRDPTAASPAAPREPTAASPEAPGGPPAEVGPRRLLLLVRGEPAGFTTLVHPGDRVDIGYA